MFNWIIKKIIGTKNQRTVKRLQPVVAEINRIEAQLQNLSDDALRERVPKWKAQFRAFHTPQFLGGVSLRIADEESVDACLKHVAGYFGALKPHFPGLDAATSPKRLEWCQHGGQKSPHRQSTRCLERDAAEVLGH
jgi:preprotein translocase subunit SecA